MQRKLIDLLAERGDLSVEAARSAIGSRLTSVIPALESAERRGAVLPGWRSSSGHSPRKVGTALPGSERV